jgi:hypothetical protein
MCTKYTPTRFPKNNRGFGVYIAPNAPTHPRSSEVHAMCTSVRHINSGGYEQKRPSVYIVHIGSDPWIVCLSGMPCVLRFFTRD